MSGGWIGQKVVSLIHRPLNPVLLRAVLQGGVLHIAYVALSHQLLIFPSTLLRKFVPPFSALVRARAKLCNIAEIVAVFTIACW